MYVGIDLAWSSGWTGLALVDDAGGVVDSVSVRSDAEIDAWLDQRAPSPTVVAVDAPLVVPNETGSRLGERELSVVYSRYGAAPYSSSLTTLGPGPSRAAALARRHGWDVDPDAPVGVGRPVCLEVYPHPALIGLFQMPYRLAYKKGSARERINEFRTLAAHLETVATLRLAANPRWTAIRAVLDGSPRASELDRVEDEIDGVVCAYIAWLWHHSRAALRVYGTLDEGYIVAPVPPAHAPIRPPSPRRPAPSASGFVAGRPNPNFGDPTWRAALHTSFPGPPTAAGPVAVELEFVLAPDQTGYNEPDLDNLIKSTIDGLVGPLGRRPGNHRLDEPDDVRVHRIVASKRPAGPTEGPGANIAVRPLAP